jgi:hypothetical protein
VSYQAYSNGQLVGQRRRNVEMTHPSFQRACEAAIAYVRKEPELLEFEYHPQEQRLLIDTGKTSVTFRHRPASTSGYLDFVSFAFYVKYGDLTGSIRDVYYLEDLQRREIAFAEFFSKAGFATLDHHKVNLTLPEVKAIAAVFDAFCSAFGEFSSYYPSMEKFASDSIACTKAE